MNTLNLITDLNQLKGKTVKLVEHSYGSPHTVLILTEDKAVAHLTFDAYQSYDQPYVDYNLVTDELETFDWFGGVLINNDILTLDEVGEIENKIEMLDELENEEFHESQRKLRYEEYLKLKEEFEVNYKLD